MDRSSRGSADSRAKSPDPGGDLAVANVRSGPSHRPQCRRIFSTTALLLCLGLMALATRELGA